MARHHFVLSIAFAGLALAAPTIARADDAQALKVSGTEALRGAKSVAIGAFNVGFIFESTDQIAATGGLMGAFGGTTKAKSELVGVTPEMMQKIADAAHADFVRQLSGAGFTVVDPGQAFATAELAKAKGQGVPAEVNIELEKKSKGKAVFYKPAALPKLVFLPGDFTGSGFSSIGATITAGQDSGAFWSYAKTSATPIVDVTYLVDFSDQKRPGAFSFGGLDVNANLSVSARFSRMTVMGANGKTTTVTFRDPVSVDGDFIQKTDASSGADKTTQAAANVAGGVAAAFGLGGMRFGKTRKFAFTAKPDNYEQGAAKAASLASAQLIGQMATLR
ncbi:MAG: hypothetical protein JSR96_00580 [Proteobacteria bacterium]|nr:hypothetical protein [Pseudomonadota bacterium]